MFYYGEELPLAHVERVQSTKRKTPSINHIAPKQHVYVPTITDDISRLASLESLDFVGIDKAYKISVRPMADTTSKYTVIGFVLVFLGGSRLAVDVFGVKHTITQAQRLRQKHVISAFGIDDHFFSVKQTCIQVQKQLDSVKPKKSPTVPDRPTLRRPKLA